MKVPIEVSREFSVACERSITEDNLQHMLSRLELMGGEANETTPAD